MPRFNYSLNESIPVEAFDENWKKLADYPSLKKAAAYLYIRKPDNIWHYLYIGNKKRPKRGVKSKITGKIYHFKLRQ